MTGRISRAFRRFFKLDRRYGVRHSGGIERTGFMSDLHAQHWLDERHLVGVVFFYDPIDLRMYGADRAEREAYRP